MSPISFVLEGNPPRTTKQQKRIVVRKVHGKMVGLHIDTPELKEATAWFQEKLLPHRPKQPYEGPLKLFITWVFPHTSGTAKKDLWNTFPKDTSPDLANMEKLFVDTMQDMGFFANDGQIAIEVLKKQWGPNPGIYVRLGELK